jgi:hypothetical protein
VHAVQLLVDALAAYGVAGAIFAAAFVTFGIQRVDPVAEHAPLGFRLIVIPGVAALWPLLLVRWVRRLRP